jgi:aspartate 1-decarboxylase
MLRYMLIAKLHRATVTECDLNYVGSIEIDEELLDLSGMRPSERVDVYDITNGARLTTYIIKGERGSGKIGINGAAARRVHEGDRIIVVNYGLLDETEIEKHTPKIILLDEHNRPVG